jgi:hypothetical protein
MDVSLSGLRVSVSILGLLALLVLVSCGNRYDLSTERGRRARIDDANFHLSHGECSAAAEAIDPLYSSIYVTDEVRIIKASTYACEAHFNLLTFISNLSSESNFLKAMAKSLDTVAGDGARDNMYRAVDVLTQGSSTLLASARSARENTFMVFVQFGVISTILRNYGAPASSGSQVTDLSYLSAPKAMTNVDACALAAAFSHISDSFSNSDLSDGTSSAAVASMEAVCTGATLPSCSSINKVRAACDGLNAASLAADLLVGGVNTNW